MRVMTDQLPTLERAAIQTQQIEALQAANNAFGRRSVVDVLEISSEARSRSTTSRWPRISRRARRRLRLRCRPEGRSRSVEIGRRRGAGKRKGIAYLQNRRAYQRGGAEVLSSAASILEQIRSGASEVCDRLALGRAAAGLPQTRAAGLCRTGIRWGCVFAASVQ